ncbi:putative reverse transcriptase domain-containing protein [Tanacetum coccineum]
MDFYLHTIDQISLYCFQAFYGDAMMGQMLYQFQENQRDYFSNDTFRGRSLVSSDVYYEVAPQVLTQKDNKYEWGASQEESFQTLKENLCNAPILTLPDGPDDFVVYYDASNQGFRCVLMQRGKSGVKDKILAAQSEASKVENAPAEMLRGLDQQREKKEDGGLYFLDRIWVPLTGNVRTLVMDEAYSTKYSIHPEADKIYYDLRNMYWWSGMKKDIATYVSKCLTCSKVKAEHQRPSGLLQQPEIPEWK